MERRYILVLQTLWIVIALAEANIQHCQNAPMPQLTRFTVPRMQLNQQRAEFVVELSYDSLLDFRWTKTISTRPADEEEDDRPSVFNNSVLYRVDLKSSPQYRIQTVHHGQIWRSTLTINRVRKEDLMLKRFETEVRVHHTCNTMTMLLKPYRRGHMDIQNADARALVEVFPTWSHKANLGDLLRAGVKVNYEGRDATTLSISKWSRYISRPGIRNFLFVLDKQSPWQNKSHNFFTEIEHKPNEPMDDFNRWKARSDMKLKVFWQRDQGVFQTKFTYQVARKVKIDVVIAMEIHYSSDLMAALNVKTCSWDVNNDIASEMIELPIEAGHDNCITCFAHGSPLPKVYLAKINADIASNIRFVVEERRHVYGTMAMFEQFPVSAMSPGEVQHYVCSAGRAQYVASLVFKVVSFTAVNLTRSQGYFELAENGPERRQSFTCTAKGTPRPHITFYESSEGNQILDNDLTPDDIGWEGPRGGALSVLSVTGDTIKARLEVTPHEGRTYHCVASNKYSRAYKSVVVIQRF